MDQSLHTESLPKSAVVMCSHTYMTKRSATAMLSHDTQGGKFKLRSRKTRLIFILFDSFLSISADHFSVCVRIKFCIIWCTSVKLLF